VESHNGKLVGARHHAPLQSVEAILTLVSGEQETRRAFARKIASAKDPELLVPYYAKLLSGQRESMPAVHSLQGERDDGEREANSNGLCLL